MVQKVMIICMTCLIRNYMLTNFIQKMMNMKTLMKR